MILASATKAFQLSIHAICEKYPKQHLEVVMLEKEKIRRSLAGIEGRAVELYAVGGGPGNIVHRA